MIIDDGVQIKGHSRNIKHFRSRGYELKVGQTIVVNPIDLMMGSSTTILCGCDNCKSEKHIPFKDYYQYTESLTSEYYCNDCKWIKYKSTCIDKYGSDNIMKSEIGKNLLEKSINDKYGVDHYSMTDEYKVKYKSTCMDKYGVENIFERIDIIDNIKLNRKKSTLLKYQDLLGEDYTILKYDDNIFSIKHISCGINFDINKTTLYSRIGFRLEPCISCKPLMDIRSNGEEEVCEFIEELGVEYIINDRNILNGVELDIYIPSHNIAIEFNGVYWHSELYKDKNYHLNKTTLSENLGIELIHIFEDDWMYKKDIIKSILRNRLSLNVNKIGARKCEIREVDSKTSRSFLDDNHIQGFCKSKWKIGLYYNNDLVSLMVFNYNSKKNEMELSRFCNKRDYNIVGGSSKLLSYFMGNYHNGERIISFADVSIFSGRLYKSLGFNLEYRTLPNYYWVVDGIRKHRFNFNKKNLIKSGYDPSLTEVEIMHSRGYYRIFSCGQDKYSRV